MSHNDEVASKNGFERYADFVQGELDAEKERRSRLDQRSLAVLTTSVALTTLLLAVGALITGKDGVAADDWVVAGILLTLVAFAASATLALHASGVHEYYVVSIDSLRQLREEAASTSEEATRRIIAGWQRKTLGSIRDLNNGKARALHWSLRLQVLALAGLCFVIGLVVIRPAGG